MAVQTRDHSSPAYHQTNVPQAQLRVMSLRTPDREHISKSRPYQPLTKNQEI
jgi:hypothetical protein